MLGDARPLAIVQPAVQIGRDRLEVGHSPATCFMTSATMPSRVLPVPDVPATCAVTCHAASTQRAVGEQRHHVAAIEALGFEPLAQCREQLLDRPIQALLVQVKRPRDVERPALNRRTASSGSAAPRAPASGARDRARSARAWRGSPARPAARSRRRRGPARDAFGLALGHELARRRALGQLHGERPQRRVNLDAVIRAQRLPSPRRTSSRRA